MIVHDLFPTGTIPKTDCAGRADSHWMSEHERRVFEAHGKKGSYTEDSITYRFNSHGYRGSEFDEPAEIRLLAIGCSFFFGNALPYDELVIERVRSGIELEIDKKTVLFNLSWSGSSNDYIARMLALSLHILRPHLVLVGFTRLNRREYVTADGRLLNYSPNKKYSKYGSVWRYCFRHLGALISLEDDYRNFGMNFLFVEALLDKYRWLFSLPGQLELEQTGKFACGDRFVGLLFEGDQPIDYARDNTHPGSLCHARLAEKYLERVRNLGWMTELR